eukprot:scaffold214765_cov31-Tisochrysis_lutea.AAC.4
MRESEQEAQEVAVNHGGPSGRRGGRRKREGAPPPGAAAQGKTLPACGRFPTGSGRRSRDGAPCACDGRPRKVPGNTSGSKKA